MPKVDESSYFYETGPTAVTLGHLVAAGLCVFAVIAGYKGVQEAKTTADLKAHLGDPISWIAAPIGDLAHTTGIVDSPD